MKIQLTTSLASEARSWKPGDILDLPKAEAERHIANGNATLVVEEKTEPAKK